MFDHNADGIRTGTGWVNSDDALLVWDRNGNGQIDSGRELFGDGFIKSNGENALDGFDALSDTDSDANGVFDSADVEYANVRLWRDLDQNGVADVGELQTLAAAGIASISLASTVSSAVVNGNGVDSTSTVTRTDGTNTTAGAINFSENLFAREFTDQTAEGHITLTEAALALPDMHGSGMVRDLREAASLGNTASLTLTSQLQQFAGATNLGVSGRRRCCRSSPPTGGLEARLTLQPGLTLGLLEEPSGPRGLESRLHRRSFASACQAQAAPSAACSAARAPAPGVVEPRRRQPSTRATFTAMTFRPVIALSSLLGEPRVR